MHRALPAVSVVALLSAGAARAAEPGYCSQPTLFGDHVVFVSEGDLWSARLPPGDEPITAWRLTSGDGDESRPHFAPDGRSLAFTGEYDGNTDVFVMPADGGPPTRMTFHPAADVALGWTPDGAAVLFRSTRAHPHGHWELWRVRRHGGMPEPYSIGECSLAAMSPTGRRLAFTPWSNEHWTWKRYRGGTAPEIWIGDLDTGEFAQLTDHPANDMFPMWVLGRIYFLSDRTGTANLHVMSASGGAPAAATTFAPFAGDPTAVESYDVRWPAADRQRRGTRIVFCQAGGLALLDVTTGDVRRLDVRLASDRVATRPRFTDPAETVTGYSLSPDGTRLLVGARGEILSYDVQTGAGRRHTHTSAAREWGVTALGDEHLALISDAAGEQQIAAAPADGSALPWLVTEDRESWLFPPAGSPDGKWIAFGDKTHRLHVVSTEMLQRRQVDASDAWEVTDYRFSPDSRWLAYVKPVASGYGTIWLHSLRTGRSFPVSDGLHDDREPRWDPAGRYLYFLSRRHLNPLMGELDFEHVYTGTTQVYAVPLTRDTPPPRPDDDPDLDAWARGPDPPDDADEADDETSGAAAPDLAIDTDGLAERHHLLAIEPGRLERLEALHGAVTYLRRPLRGLLDDDDDEPGPLGPGRAVLQRYDLVKREQSEVAVDVSGYAVSRGRTRLAFPAGGRIRVVPVDGSGDAKEVDVSSLRLRVTIRDEWRHILREAWRLQRDFYWAPNYKGVDWPAMLTRYEALLPRVGTRQELNRLIGQMIGELGTSHTYVRGGQRHDEADPVSVGLLGADVEWSGAGGYRIARILPRQSWDESLRSPLAEPHRDVEVGDVVVAINGRTLDVQTNPFDLLQDQADKLVVLTLTDADGDDRRDVRIRALASERPLRYAAWVEANRRHVDDRSGGRLGYVHVPDMGGAGLAAFGRQFHPQIERKGLVVDVRDNNGGFVSQMIVQRLNRRAWAFMRPRHGTTHRYPRKSLYGHMAVLIDQFAGSDGDIFPESFRLNEMGPLIGTRTWGGVVGIRGDKPFVDMGLSTQPEFAWWEPVRGWSLENEGVTPDVRVVIRPEDRMAGRDPQLDRAIEWLLARLDEDPKTLPPAPPWPDDR